MHGHLRCLLPLLALLTACPEPIVPIAEEAPACVWNEDCGPNDACLEGVCIAGVESPEETCRASGLTCGLAIAPVTGRTVDCSTVANFCAEQRPGTSCGADDLCCPESCATAACGEVACALDGMWGQPCYDACASFEQVWASPAPSARSGASVAADPRSGRALLFGGVSWDEGLGRLRYGDTWSLAEDGRSWEELSRGGGPRARSFAALAFDPASERFVLFGGASAAAQGAAGLERDTWLFDGVGWSERSNAGVGPSARANAGFGWSEALGGLLLVGGLGPDFQPLDDLWLFTLVNGEPTWVELELRLPAAIDAGRVAAFGADLLVWGSTSDRMGGVAVELLWRFDGARFHELRREEDVWDEGLGCMTSLPDGRVLLIGARHTGASAEILSPDTTAVEPVGGMIARSGCFAVAGAGVATAGYGERDFHSLDDLHLLDLP